MDYQAGTGGRGDGEPGANREIVYCHACEHEWFKDALHGLVCPQCESEATEIISPNNDPREFHDAPSPLSSGDGFPAPRRADTDSDPDEADIEEHLYQGPHGFRVRRSTWDHANQHGQGARQPPDPADGDQVIHRFYELLNTFGAGVGAMGRPNPDDDNNQHRHAFGAGVDAQGRPNLDDDDNNPHRRPTRRLGGPFIAGFGGPVRTFTSRIGNGITSLTISTGPVYLEDGARPPDGRGLGNDDFQSVFSNILNGAGPPRPGQGPGAGAPGGPPNLAASLHQILNMLAPGNGQFGDAVYTQEALDRIISSMMETNALSNAAPPASADAIGKLQRKKVDDEMLGPEDTAECTICIDELKKGEEVVYLPCKHWFHDTCVVMWLKEHNTCPICRTPIEDRAENASAGQQGPEGGSSGDGAGPASGPSDPAPPGGGGQPHPFFGFGPPNPYGGGNGQGLGSGAPTPPHPSTRPPHARTLHWSFQSPSAQAPRDQHGEGGSRGPRGYNVYPPRPYDSQSSSRQSPQRRHSMSPPATSAGARTRQRSPTPSSWDRDRQQAPAGQGQSQAQGPGSGPLSWLRNRLSRSGPSDGQGPDGGPR